MKAESEAKEKELGLVQIEADIHAASSPHFDAARALLAYRCRTPEEYHRMMTHIGSEKPSAECLVDFLTHSDFSYIFVGSLLRPDAS